MNDKDIEYYLGLALMQAKKAEKLNEVPIGAIVVNDSKTITGKGFNQTENKSDPTAHAEILAIQDATRLNKDWRLDDFTLFSTLEPCPMCLGAIKEARIKRVYFGCENSKKVGQGKEIIISNIKNKSCQEILKNFFVKLR
ncbi:nucleoside deaminase [bacterium]|jgi:tRNA(adenine34) deaminase|nr:nucleoside deaminase [bacterium]MBT3795081.1 nucleoside deaminase [bacterium]MBT4633892.1 nucleoside deaminase [bacterium]